MSTLGGEIRDADPAGWEPERAVAFVVAFLDAPDWSAADALGEHRRVSQSFERLVVLAEAAVAAGVDVQCALMPVALVQLRFDAGSGFAPQRTLDSLAEASGVRLVALCESDRGRVWALRSHGGEVGGEGPSGWIVATPERQVFAEQVGELPDLAAAAVDSLAAEATEESVAQAQASVAEGESLPARLVLEPIEPEMHPGGLWVSVMPRRWVYLEGWRAAQLGLGCVPYCGLMEQAWRQGFDAGGGRMLSLPFGEEGAEASAMLELRETLGKRTLKLPVDSLVRSGFHVEADRLMRVAARREQIGASGGVGHVLRLPLSCAGPHALDEFAEASQTFGALVDRAEELAGAGWTVMPPSPSLSLTIFLVHSASTFTEAQAIVDAHLPPRTLVDYFTPGDEHHLLIAGETLLRPRPPGSFPLMLSDANGWSAMVEDLDALRSILTPRIERIREALARQPEQDVSAKIDQEEHLLATGRTACLAAGHFGARLADGRDERVFVRTARESYLEGFRSAFAHEVDEEYVREKCSADLDAFGDGVRDGRTARTGA